MTSNPDFKVTVLFNVEQKWYKIELYLQWTTNRKSHMVYRSAPFSMTLNNPKPTFQGQIILCLQLPPQINKACNFWYKFAIKGYIPLSDFYKISLGEGVPGLHHHAEFHCCGLKKNVGLQPPKSLKIVIFGINLPLRGNHGSIEKLEYRRFSCFVVFLWQF